MSGSIIQRSIVPKDLSTILNVATIPYEGVGQEKQDLKLTVTQIFGVSATDCLTQQEYERSLRMVINPDFKESFISYLHHSKYLYYDLYEFFDWLGSNNIGNLETGASLSSDIVACQLSGLNTAYIRMPFDMHFFPLFATPGKRGYKNELFRHYEISPDYFIASLKIRVASLMAMERIATPLKDIYKHHVPYGKSPETSSETLKNIIKQAKSIVVAPLITGSIGSATLISTGDYLLALKCSLAGAGCTIILISTVSLADHLIGYISRQRGVETFDK